MGKVPYIVTGSENVASAPGTLFPPNEAGNGLDIPSVPYGSAKLVLVRLKTGAKGATLLNPLIWSVLGSV